MTSQPIDPSFESKLKRAGLISLFVSVLFMLIGITTWMLNKFYYHEKRIPNISMSPVIVLSLILIIAILYHYIKYPERRSTQRFARLGSLGLMGLILLKFIDFFLPFELWLGDKILAVGNELENVVLGRMSETSAVNIFLMVLSLFLISSEKIVLRKVAGYLTTMAVCINVIVVVGYIFGTPLLYNFTINGNLVIPMSLASALAFISIDVAMVIVLGVTYFPLRPLVGKSAKARLLRSFLPLTLCLVVFNGVIFSLIPTSRYFNYAVISAVCSLISLFVATIVIYRVSRIIGGAIDRAEEERRRAEEAFRENEELFKRAFDHAPIGMSLLDLRGRFMLVNASLCRMMGYNEKELFRMRAIDITHPDDLEASQEKVKQLVNKQIGAFTLVKRYIHKSGEIIWANLSAAAILDKEQQPLYMICHVNDITAEKKAQVLVQESEDRFRTLAEANFEGIVVHERGIILDANSAFAEMFGYEINEIIGKNIGDFAAPEYHDIISQNIKTGYSKSYEAVGVRKDGSRFPGELNGKTLPYKDRTVRVNAIRDITLRKENELVLRESEQRYRLMFENNPTPMWVYDIETLQFLDVNNALVKYYGYSKSELLTMSIKDLHLDEDVSLALLINKMSKNTKGINLAGEWKLKRKDGSVVYTEIISHGFLYNNRSAKLVIANDITDRKRAEESIRKSEKRFRALIERSADVYLIMDQKGVVTYTAPSTLQVLGYEPSEFIGTNGFDYVHPDDIKYASAMFSDLLQTPGVPFKNQYRNRHKNGSWLWMEAVAINLLDDSNINGVVINTRDITKKKMDEDKLRFQATILQGIGESVIVTDLQGIITYWNPASAALYGFSQEEALGQSLAIIYPKKHKEAISNNVKYILEKEDFIGVRKLIDKEGTEKYIDVKTTKFFNEEGQVKGIIGIQKDITERIRTEEALKITEERFSKVFKASPIGISIVSAKDSRYVDVNDSFARLAGVEREEIIGKRREEIDSIMHYHVSESDRELVANALRTTGSIYMPELKIESSKAPTRYVQIYVEMIMVDGEPCIMNMVNNITDLKNAEQAQKQSEERFSKIFTASPIAIIITTLAEGRFVEMNDAFTKLIGIPKEALIGKALHETGTQTSMPMRAEYIQEIVKHGRFVIPEVTAFTRNGVTKYAQTFMELIQLGDEQFILSYINDITDIRNSQEALGQSQRQFQTLFEEAPVAIAIIKDAVISTVNKGFLQTFGYTTSEEVKDKRIASLLIKEDAAFISHKMEGLHEYGTFSYDLMGVTKDGAQFPLHINIASMQLPDGTAFIAYMQNISDRMEANTLLEESQRSLATLISNLPGMVYRCKNDKDWTMEFVSEGSLELTGYSSSDFVIERKISYNDIVHPEDRQKVWEDVQDALNKNKPFTLNYRIVTASGKIKQVWEQGASVVLPNGRTVLEGFITSAKK